MQCLVRAKCSAEYDGSESLEPWVGCGMSQMDFDFKRSGVVCFCTRGAGAGRENKCEKTERRI